VIHYTKEGFGVFKEYIDLNQYAIPGTTVSALVKESKYLYENAVFEIVAHALNIHRKDIIAELSPKEIVKKSKMDLNTDVRDLYYNKVKTIYGEIIGMPLRLKAL